MQPPQHYEVAFTLDEIAQYTATTCLVTQQEIEVGHMAGDDYVIILPEGLAAAIFMWVIPQKIWNMRVTFLTWSLLNRAEIEVTRFKV
jgi:hypothetical protein